VTYIDLIEKYLLGVCPLGSGKVKRWRVWVASAYGHPFPGLGRAEADSLREAVLNCLQQVAASYTERANWPQSYTARYVKPANDAFHAELLHDIAHAGG
jgi:hypothetical protein